MVSMEFLGPAFFILLALAFWVGTAAICGVLARSFGRNPWLWFAFALVAPVLAFVVLLGVEFIERLESRPGGAFAPAGSAVAPNPAAHRPPAPPAPPPPPPAEDGVPRAGWYVAAPGGSPIGPLDAATARRRAEAEGLLTWHHEQGEWRPLDHGLLAHLDASAQGS